MRMRIDKGKNPCRPITLKNYTLLIDSNEISTKNTKEYI